MAPDLSGTVDFGHCEFLTSAGLLAADCLVYSAVRAPGDASFPERAMLVPSDHAPPAAPPTAAQLPEYRPPVPAHPADEEISGASQRLRGDVIVASSTLGRGSTFVVSLPVRYLLETDGAPADTPRSKHRLGLSRL